MKKKNKKKGNVPLIMVAMVIALVLIIMDVSFAPGCGKI